MQLDKFTNGRQLVSLVLDCLNSEYTTLLVTFIFPDRRLYAAHKLAATHPSVVILHRDITGGNILIYPKVVTKEDGSRRLEWTGILSDWEISKPIDADAKPRQPERTVCPL